MKRIICLLLLMCLAVPAVAFAEEYHEYVGYMMIVNCKREVSLRAEPTTESERLAWVPYHALMSNCYSGYGEYYYVEYDGTPGYVHSDYLEVYEGDLELAYAYPEFYEEMQIVGCPEWTTLREMADVNAKELAKIPLGAVVYDCMYYGDDFTYVNYNGLAGYVLTEYITLGSDNYIEPDLSVKYVTNCEAKVSLRAEPTSESERLDWVPKDTAIEAIDAKDGYFYVCYEGQYGYVFGDYLAYIGYIKEYAGEMVVLETDFGAPMYVEPAPEFGVLTMVPAGTVFNNCCYEAHNGYYFVDYMDFFGYVHGDYLAPYTGEDEPYEMEYLGLMQVYNCYDWVSMRAQPDVGSERLLKVPLGEIVSNCYAYSNGFTYVEYDGRCGFILSEYLTEPSDDIVLESYDSMRVVDCDSYIPMYEYPGFESRMLQKVPLDAIVTGCVLDNEDYFYCYYDGIYGYIDRYFLEPVEGPYADSDDLLMNCRIKMHYENAVFGVYLICDTMGGEWSILNEKNHLQNVLNSLPDEWQPIAMTIPDERIIEVIGGGELYLVIPSEDFVPVTVNRLQLGYDGFTGIVEEELYYSHFSEPFLLRCNVYESVMDCEVLFEDNTGRQLRWYPSKYPYEEWVDIAIEDGFAIDFTHYE